MPWSHEECFQSSVCALVSWRVFPIQCVCLGLMESVSNPVCVTWSHGECFQSSVCALVSWRVFPMQCVCLGLMESVSNPVCVPWSHGECFQSSVCALVSWRVFPIQRVCLGLMESVSNPVCVHLLHSVIQTLIKLDWLTSKSVWYTYIVRSAEDLVQNIEINNNYMYLLHHVNLET